MAYTANPNDRVPYSPNWMETHESEELQQRLALYQVFLKLYQQNQGLLEEILSLENSGSRNLASVALPFIQGVVLGQDVYVVTNLLHGETQALTQPQNTWVIGRDPRRVVLPIEDTRLSRCHAAIKYVEHQGFYLVDLDSRNGSYVNGERVRERLLQDGDRIRLGSLTVVFFLCQTLRHLRSLATPVTSLLNEWEPPITDLDAEAEVPEQSTGKALDETSMFLRSRLISSKFTIQP